MSDLIEKAAQAATREEAVRVLTEGGVPLGRAEEIVAMMFGDSDGDVVEVPTASNPEEIPAGAPALPSDLPEEIQVRAELRVRDGGDPTLEPEVDVIDPVTNRILSDEDNRPD